MSNRGTVKIVLHKEWTIDLSQANPNFDMEAIFEALAENDELESGDSADCDHIYEAFKSVLTDDCQSEKDSITVDDFDIVVSGDATIEGKE